MISGTVKCPAEYFRKMATVDYSDWRKALAREFYQNSIDARAKNIWVTVNGEKITIEDDGTGMNLDIIQNKLLVLGGSAKDNDNAVGAFGKAKELLYFSWKDWSIHTKDLYVEGHGPEYIIVHTDKKIKGTISTIYVDMDLCSVESAFKIVAALMDTKTKIFVNGVEIICESHRGRLIKSFGFADLYLNKSKHSTYMDVRVSGIWMFSNYLGTNSGQFILDLTKSSIECLTSNRDSMKWLYSNEIMTFVRQIMVNEKSVTSSKNNLVRTRIEGMGKVRIRPELIESAVNTAPSLAMAKSNLMEIVSKMGQDLNILKTRLKNESFIDRDRWTFIGYKPDFELSYIKKQRGFVKRYMKKKKSLLLAKIWTEIVKQVILDNSNGYMEFTAGFTFDPEKEAEVRKQDNNISILLNPLLVGSNGGWAKKALSNRFLLSEDLKDKAIHEIAHLSYTDHNELFVLTMHSIRAKVTMNHNVYTKISRMK